MNHLAVPRPTPPATPRRSPALSASPRTRRRRRWTIAVLLVSGLTLLTACSDSGSSTAADVDVEHVHALDVDPDNPDGLLVATHHGLVRYSPDAGLSAVGELRSDFMGFTVGPDDVLYASGHPGSDEDGPFALGLISSADGGESWDQVSLSGEADFHALDAHAQGIYGYDGAGEGLLVSADGRTWQNVPSETGFIDLAADPSSERLFGTTGDGRLVESEDGGRTFEPVAYAPSLVLIDVNTDGDLVGVGTDGTLHTWSSSEGWQQRDGAADEGLQAITAGADGVVWMVDGRGLVRSEDGGDTFEEMPGW